MSVPTGTRTNTARACRPPQGSRGARQRRFNAFRREYDEERPHAALGGDPPASRYAPSLGPYPDRLPPVEYLGHFRVFYVSRNGGIRFRNRWVNLTHILIEEYVGLEEVGDGVWDVYFGTFCLGRFDERERHIHGFHNRNKIKHW